MKHSSPEADFLRLAQVAELLNISAREVARLRDRGELAAVWSGSKCLIPRQSYDALRDRWLAQARPAPVALPPRGRLRKVSS